VQAPHGLTLDAATAIVAALEGMPEPRVIQCATGNRAGAALGECGGVCTRAVWALPLGTWACEGLILTSASHLAPSPAALYAGLKGGLTPAATLEWAAAKGLKCVGAQPLRNWIGTSLTALSGPPPAPGLIFRQLFDPTSSTYTYLLADAVSREALLIDPVDAWAERDATLVRELGLNLRLALNTHVHADHVFGNDKLKALVKGGTPLRSALAAATLAAADVCLHEGDVVHFGARSLRVLSTPGHTNGCLSFVLDDESAVFTGDALLVRGCGRTDFQEGSADTLYQSVTGKLFTLPSTCAVYPGHDYNGHTRSSISEERALNNRLGYGRSQAEFVAIMAALQLAPPKLIDVAVPANMQDGIVMEAGAASARVPACERCRQDGSGPKLDLWLGAKQI
jgi:sulfur dioxygenase